MDTWRKLPSSAQSPALQLAGGDALLAGLADPANQPPPPALRWYTMHAPAVVLGTGQPLRDFDPQAVRAAGVALHRRASGGTAVLVDPLLLMQDIVLPKGHPLYQEDVTASYGWLGAVWVAALETLGVAARTIAIDEARADTKALDALTRRSCYGGRSPFEVLADGRKLVGLAQVRRRGGALLQTGIYTHWQPAALAALLALSPDERATLTARLHTRVVGLSDLLPAPEPHSLPPLLMQAFETALTRQHGVRLHESPWNATEQATRTREASGRYAALAIGAVIES